MIDFLAGVVAMASWVAGLVFLRFHGRTADRIFLFFAAAFWLDALGRTLEVALRWADEETPDATPEASGATPEAPDTRPDA